MAKFEVTTEFLLHTKVKVVVEADSKEGAIDRAAEIAPTLHDARGWRATATLRAPKHIKNYQMMQACEALADESNL